MQTTKEKYVVHIRTQNYDVRIDRATKWGNPFIIGIDGDRAAVIRKYRKWLMTQPRLLAALPELKGKTLGCWCAPSACHGDILAELANRDPDPATALSSTNPLP